MIDSITVAAYQQLAWIVAAADNYVDRILEEDKSAAEKLSLHKNTVVVVDVVSVYWVC